MTRRTIDGHVRFSSYHDVQRTLSSCTPDMVQLQLRNTKKNRPDTVVALLESLRLIDEVRSTVAHALSACYASDVVESVPENVDISEARTTFINRIRQLVQQSTAVNMQLAMHADLQVKRNKLTVPRFADQIIVDKCEADSVSFGWKFLPFNNKKIPYQLFRTYELASVHCGNTEEASYQVDKLVGVALPEYNKSATKEIAVFVTDKDSGKYPHIRYLDRTKSRSQFIAALRANDIRIA